MRSRWSVRVLVLLATLALPFRASTQAPPAASRTQIVFLGTGGPNPKPDKMGSALAIIVNGTPYLVDAGTGIVRRASAATAAGVKGLEMPKLSRVFITHLHSDHTIGLPDLISTPWIMHRTDPLQVYGPSGVAAMIDHLTMAYSADNAIRIHGLERGNTTGNRVVAHEIAPGVVYRDSNVTVKAFLVRHGSWPQAFGYRFETPDRTIVVSGDTSPAESVAESCNGCDVLIHEAYTQRGYDASTKEWQDYVTHFHTSTYELATIASKARPHTLILYHQMYFGGPKDTDAGMLQEIRSRYHGTVISARDLDVY